MQAEMGFQGHVRARLIREPKAPLAWKVRNWLSRRNWLGWLAARIVAPVANWVGIATMIGSLRVRLIRADGSVINFGLVSLRVVTTAFVNFMVDQLQTETSTWGDFKYHDSGVGTTAAVVGDTDIETTDGESRVAGTQTEGASTNIYKTVATIAYTTTKAITEHGVFSAASSGTLVDRHVFSAINVENGDSIEFTYELTCNAGG